MKCHILRRSPLFALWLFGIGLSPAACTDPRTPIHSTAAERLQPAASIPGDPSSMGTIYVPVYSTLHLGDVHRFPSVELAVTVSVRNVSPMHPITLDQVRYFDSNGKQLRDYLDKPSTLPPMGSVEFIIQRTDTTGGPGANFLVRWQAAAVVDEPLAEAVMVGWSGNSSISFSSRGRALTVARER